MVCEGRGRTLAGAAAAAAVAALLLEGGGAAAALLLGLYMGPGPLANFRSASTNGLRRIRIIGQARRKAQFSSAQFDEP
eukprot:1183782-Prorocentrum_minimum.AAC.6